MKLAVQALDRFNPGRKLFFTGSAWVERRRRLAFITGVAVTLGRS
jgi:hypothetical protein